MADGTAAGRGGRGPLTREAIVAAARAAIEEHGLDELSLRHVARQLGVTAPALYAHVAGKRDLLRAVAETALADLTARFDAVGDIDAVARVKALSLAYVDYALEHPQLFRTMFLFPPELPDLGPSGDELPAATKAFQTSLAAIEEAIGTGRFRPADPVEAGLTMWTVTHGIATVLLMGYDGEAGAALADRALDTVIAGLRS